MKKIYIYVFCICLFTSCDKWLDVSSSDQIKEHQLFENGEGYRKALLGIYQELSTKSLYGKNMTWGFVDCLGQLYDPDALSSGSELSQAHTYNYEAMYVKPVVEDIWKSMYLAIANCNNLIQNIEGASGSIFEYLDEEKTMIQGEAYALRGFMHFDLLRLFAPSLKAGGSGTYLPYCDTYPAVWSKKLSTQDVLKRVIEDLEKAQHLTAQFDTLPDNIKALQSMNYRVENQNYFQERGIFYSYRGTRMNYLNVTALLARVYLYAGELEKAYKAAQYVLDFEGMKFPSRYGGYNGNTKSREDILLAFFNRSVLDYYEPYTGSDGYLKLRNVADLYAGETSDKRYTELTTEVIKETRISTRYKRYSSDPDDSKDRVNGPLIPVLRLGEMYHIVCEYYVTNNRLSDAIESLDELRRERGLGYDNLDPDMTEKEFMKKLRLDAHKEFVSEGQVFFMYKRLNLPIWDGNTNGEITPGFVLPTPDSENV